MIAKCTSRLRLFTVLCELWENKNLIHKTHIFLSKSVAFLSQIKYNLTDKKLANQLEQSIQQGFL